MTRGLVDMHSRGFLHVAIHVHRFDLSVQTQSGNDPPSTAGTGVDQQCTRTIYYLPCLLVLYPAS